MICDLKILQQCKGQRCVYNLHKWSVHCMATEKDRQPAADKLHANVFIVAKPVENLHSPGKTRYLYAERQHVQESNPQPL